MRRDVLERRVERGREQEDAGREGHDAPGLGSVAARGAPVEHGGGGREREEERLEAERGRAHVAAASRAAWVRLQRGRRIRATQIPRVTSCSTVITIPASCWSVTAEIP